MSLLPREDLDAFRFIRGWSSRIHRRLRSLLSADSSADRNTRTRARGVLLSRYHMTKALLLFALILTHHAFAAEASSSTKPHDLFEAAGVSLNSRLGLGVEVDFGVTRVDGEKMEIFRYLGATVAEKGYGFHVGRAAAFMMGGVNLSAGYLNTGHERVSDRDRDFITARASVIWLGLQLGFGALKGQHTTLGEGFISFVWPFLN